MKEKIAHLIKSEGLTSSRLAEILETQPSRISHIVSGRNKPSFDLLQQILRRFPRINPDWLLLDSPTMYRADNESLGSNSAMSESMSGAASSFDLFGLGEVVIPNSAQSTPPNLSAGGAGFDPSNSPSNSPKNQQQNQVQNQLQNMTFSPDSNPPIQRIIVLYADGTFRTYNAR